MDATTRKPAVLISAWMAAAMLATGAAAQSDVAKFYTGKQIDFIIGSAPGGGYGIYASVLARHIGKHIPGQPAVVGRNLEGAGSLIAANLLYNKSPRDGTTFGALFMGAIVEPLLGDASQTQYDGRKFNYIGSANQESSVCVAWHTSPIQTFADTFEQQMFVGSAGVGSSIGQYPTLLNNVLGTKFKVVTGYPGSREAALAMERGEMTGICGIQWTSFATSYQDWLANKKVRILAQISSPEGNPELNAMGVPKIWEFVKSAEARQTLSVIFGQHVFGRPYVLPPGVPADRVEAFRQAFDATMKDPAFLEEAKRAKLAIDPVPGAAVQKAVEQIYDTPKDQVERARAALK